MWFSCGSCGAPATHDCDETGQFVCGVPLCGECEHVNFEDGTNGGVGFDAMPLPEEVRKRHCKKTEQKFKPWYEESEYKS